MACLLRNGTGGGRVRAEVKGKKKDASGMEEAGSSLSLRMIEGQIKVGKKEAG